jgi:putative transposase
MSFHQRNLPHCYPPGAILFVTWRLFGSVPWSGAGQRPAPQDAGREFAQSDYLLDRATNGPLWLKDHRIAALVARALEQGANEFRLYDLFAWVIMPNHVHVVMKPIEPLPVIMRWIKDSTVRSANLILGRTGKPFWQYESYDRCVCSDDELNRVICYVERNPVRAGLACAIEAWPWLSAGRRPTPQ